MMSLLTLRLSQVPIALLFVAALSNSSDALFLQSPKTTIMNFLGLSSQTTQPKPIHLYHLHYYPVPMSNPVLPTAPPTAAPTAAPTAPPTVLPSPNIEFDFSSLPSIQNLLSPPPNWSSSGPSYDAEFIPPSFPSNSYWSSSSSWPSSAPIHPKSPSWGWDNILEKDHTYEGPKTPGLLLQVPLKQQIIVYQPPPKDTKYSLLKTFLKKLRRINDALFHPEDDSDEEQDHAPHISNSLSYNFP